MLRDLKQQGIQLNADATKDAQQLWEACERRESEEEGRDSK